MKNDPPEELDSWGLEVWNRMYPVVTADGTVTESERELFICYCDAAGVKARAMAEIRSQGILKKKKKKKKAAGALDVSDEGDGDTGEQNPWLNIKRRAADDVAKFARLLGLTSIDRVKVARIKSGGEKETKKPLPSSRPKTAFERLQNEGTAS